MVSACLDYACTYFSCYLLDMTWPLRNAIIDGIHSKFYPIVSINQINGPICKSIKGAYIDLHSKLKRSSSLTKAVKD